MKKLTILFTIFVILFLAVDATAMNVKSFRGHSKTTAEDLIFYDSYDPKTKKSISGSMLISEFNKLAKTSKTKITQHEYDPKNCKKLVYHGNPDEKLDVVFVASHFYPETGEGSKFAQDVDRFLQEFYDFSQYSDNIEKFNFYRVDDIDPDDTCACFGSTCDTTGGTPGCPGPTNQRERVIALASQCTGFDRDNHDQVIVMFDEDNVNLRFSTGENKWGVANMQSTKDILMMHEFGHSFGNLADEKDSGYPAPDHIDPSTPNCAKDKPGHTCQDKWGDLIGQEGVGCFQGCGSSNWYRPTLYGSIMNLDAIWSGQFCAVSKRHVNELLSIYSDSAVPNPHCIILFDELKITYNSMEGDPNFDDRLDLNFDNQINLIDFSMFAQNYHNDNWCENQLN